MEMQDGVIFVEQGIQFPSATEPGHFARVRDAVAYNSQWQETVPNPEYDPSDPESLQMIPNPISPGILLINRLLDWCAAQVKIAEQNQRKKIVEQEVNDDVDAQRALVKIGEWQ